MPEKIKKTTSGLQVSNNPIIPFIEGDGIGRDIWRAASRVLDIAVATAYDNAKKIEWKEIFAGQKSYDKSGEWLPEETLNAFSEYLVGIKGPLTTPIGGGMRSLNVAIRQKLDLYVCQRPVRYYQGCPSPVKKPEKVDMVIFRENTEDVYAGKEVAAGSPEAKDLLKFLRDRFGWTDIREDAGIGIKPISETASKRLIKAAIEFAIKNNRKSVTLVHKGNIQKFTEGAFRNWGYELAKAEFADVCVTYDDFTGDIPKGKILIKDCIADAFLEQSLARAEDYDVVATMNLNGDYISDSLVGQVGGVGIAPGANINCQTGCAVFEATHGTAPTLADKDVVNPGSVILSGAMMLRYIGWDKAADLIEAAMVKTISQKRVTFDFANLMNDATEVKCSEFADLIINNING